MSEVPRPMPVTTVCRIAGASRASFYRLRCPRARPPQKRGPRPKLPDAELAVRIRRLLEDLETQHGLRGEGHRKVHARLRFVGVRVARRRVLWVMREHGLLAPTRRGRPRGPYIHDGVLVTETPNEMWGTDATMAYTRRDGWAWVFVAVDHCTTECVGVHAAKPGTRYEALEPIHQGVRERFAALGPDVAKGLTVRHDHGSQYISDAFQSELALLGIASSPSFVRSPEGNGVAERFIRTLKEQCLWVEHFESVEDLRRKLLAFKERYNHHWILERHGYATPDEARKRLEKSDKAA